MRTAKVFKSGNSQAVRIPKDLLIEESELYIRKVGNTIILRSKNDIWDSFRESIDNFTQDLFENGREQPAPQDREDL